MKGSETRLKVPDLVICIIVEHGVENEQDPLDRPKL